MRSRQAILQTRRWLLNRRLVFVGDNGFFALDLLAAVRRHVTMTARLRLDANRYAPAPERRSGQRGRTPMKGHPLPKLSVVLTIKKTVWTSLVVSQLYNAQQRTLLVAAGTALWWDAGIPPVPIRCVLVCDPSSEHEPSAFLRADLDVTPAAILSWLVSRWRVESTFQEVCAHLGVEAQRQSSDLAILRTAPALLGLFSLITVQADGQAREGPEARRRLIQQARAHLQRRHRRGPPRPLDGSEFIDVPETG
jgi:hypothetical protein